MSRKNLKPTFPLQEYKPSLFEGLYSSHDAVSLWFYYPLLSRWVSCWLSLPSIQRWPGIDQPNFGLPYTLCGLKPIEILEHPRMNILSLLHLY